MVIRTRGLELEVAGVEEEASTKEQDETGSLYKDPEYWASPLGLETYLSPESCTQGTVGLPIPVLMRIP